MNRRRVLAGVSVAALALLALVAAAVYFIGSPEFEELAADYTVRLIESRTGTRASLEGFDLDFWGQRVTLDGLVLRGDEAPSEDPLVAIERIEIGFRLRSLLQRRIDLWSLRVLRPRISLRIGEGGETNIPTPPREGEAGEGRSLPLEIGIGDFVLSQGDLEINESRVDIDFHLADVQGLFDFDEAAHILSGHLGYGGAIEGAVDQPIPYRLEADFTYDRGDVELRPAVVTSAGTQLVLEGGIDDFLGSRVGMLDYTGTVDLPFLNYFLPETRFAGLSQVAGSLDFSTRDFSTAGHARADSLRVDDWLATDFESDFTYAFPGRTVVATNINTGFAEGEAHGEVMIGPLPGSPVVEVDLAYQDIDPLYFGDLFPWGVDFVSNSRAAGTLRGWLRGGVEDFDLEGDLELDGQAVPEAGPVPLSVEGTTRFQARPGAVEVDGLSASYGRSHARADGLISRERLSLEATLESEDLSELAFLYAGYEGLGGRGRFQGEITGSIASPVFRGDFTGTTGRTNLAASGVIGQSELALDATLESDDLGDLAFLREGLYGSGRLSGHVSGSIPEPAIDGNYSVRIGSTMIESSGVISRPELSLQTTIESGDLTDLAFIYPEANGSGRIDGRISGRVSEPAFDGDIALSGWSYGDWDFDRVEGGVAVTRDELNLSDLEVVRGSSEVEVSGSWALGGSRADLDVVIAQLDARELERFTPQPVGGRVSGRVHLDAVDPLSLAGHLQVEDLSYDGHHIGDTSADVIYQPELIDLADLRIDQGNSHASGTIRYDRLLDEIDSALEISGFSVEEFRWIGIPDSLEGRIGSSDLTVSGSSQEPSIAGRLVLEDFSFGRQSFSRLVADLETRGRILEADVTTDAGLRLETEIDLGSDGYPFSGMAMFGDFDAGELASLATGRLIASGAASFQGSLRELDTLNGEGRINALTATFGERTLDVTEPFDFEFTTREVRVSPVRLRGIAGTSLELYGTIAIESDVPLDLNVYGPIDLSLVASQYENLELSGEVALDASIEGTVSDPLLVGVATLNDVSVGHSDVFLGMTGLRGDIFLDGPRASLRGIQGRIGSGTVTLNGTFGLAGEARGVMDIGIEASDVRPRRLRGLRTAFDGTLGLRGTPETLVLEGNIQLDSMSFNESFDEFLRLFDRGPEAPPAEGLPDSLALAVHVEGNQNIRVENELVSLEGRVDLDVGGTFGQPSLTGHSEISRGTLFLQGRRYRITRGNVDFVDPVGIDPRIDIQAEADIRDYRVRLLFTGQGSDIQMTMNSDPALPETEIVSLIAGGRTSDELCQEARLRTGSCSLTDEESLFQGAASSILADMLQERVGSRLGLLNSVRIDPFQVGAATGDTVTRLTVSEQITSDLEITYSQDLSSNRQEVIQIEYFLNGDTSFIATRDGFGRLSLDIKLRKRFD